MRKRVGTVWLAGCSGCHMSFLDIDERLLDIAAKADIVKCPIVDGKAFPDVDVVLVEGAVANEEHFEEIRHIRAKSKILVAFGDCAVTGNVSAIRNLVGREAALKRSYVEAESNVPGDMPCAPGISPLRDRVQPLHEIVKVDYFLTGCPPSADAIFQVLDDLLEGRTPHLPEVRNG